MRFVLDVERLIDAPADVVYRARTDIDLEREISRMFDETADVQGDVRVGRARVVEWGPDTERCRVTQTFLEIEPERIVYSELLEVPPSPVYTTTITETIGDCGDATLIQFHVEGFPTREERDLHRKGYNIVLDRLEVYLSVKT